MKRSQSSSRSSSSGLLVPSGGGLNLGNSSHGSFDLRRGRPGRPNSSAASIGRDLLCRPRLDRDPASTREALSRHASFTVSAADAPAIIHKVCSTPLKSCLSSGSMLGSGGSQGGNNSRYSKNEEFGMVRSVSFSQIRVREYEVTLGDNPAVSSGAPLSLGWRYNPKEDVTSIPTATDTDDYDYDAGRRSRGQLRLSESERHDVISANPDVSMKDLAEALMAVEATRLERKESLGDLVGDDYVRERRGRVGVVMYG